MRDLDYKLNNGSLINYDVLGNVIGCTKVLTEYIRDRKNRRVGILVGIPTQNNDAVYIGWSKCNMTLDRFDKDVAFDIAFKRAMLAEERCLTIPLSIGIGKIESFITRCRGYFKGKYIMCNRQHYLAYNDSDV